MTWRTWRAATAEALYGEHGFYRRPGSAVAHFRTAAGASPLWGRALGRLAARVDAALGLPDGFAVVDVGAGDGAALRALAQVAPARWRLLGVELTPRPAGLPPRVDWAGEPPARVRGLVVAAEWLDTVPVDVVERGPEGLRLVEVDERGRERLAGPPPPADAAWLARWWPLRQVGERAEVGRPRDERWAGLLARLAAGAALAVDYAADPARHRGGTLTGYRAGRQVAPVPDGSTDLTAHVRLESAAAAAGGPALILDQAVALARLGVRRHAVPAGRAGGDPAGWLAAVAAAGAAAELTDPGGLGGHRWLLQPVGVPPSALGLPTDVSSA